MTPSLVLVVEDHADAREMLSEWLEVLGLTVLQAENGQKALDVLKEGARPALVLLDLMMPVMDGPTFMKEAKAAGLLDETPVLVISAALENTALPPGVTAALPKPVDLNLLKALVQQYVSAPRVRRIG